MVLEQFYLGCLAHASYLPGSEGIAAIVDRRRDVDQQIYLGDRSSATFPHPGVRDPDQIAFGKLHALPPEFENALQ